MIHLRRLRLVALAAILVVGLVGCDRSTPSCDPIIYGDLPCL